jgi:hypothetical protein
MNRVVGLAVLLSAASLWAEQPGHGKHIVLIAADQEYRSQESIPALARILATRHGFECTVLYSINRQTGKIDSSVTDNVPGLDALRTAEVMVLFARFLELPDDQMKEIMDYTNSGRPIVGLRTSTHAFNYQKHLDSPYAKYSWNSKDPAGGYGRLVLGETWIAHHGAHQTEKKLLPVAWIKSPRVFMTTMGHALDFKNEGFRRLMVNACYWAAGLEKQIPAHSDVDFVGEYNPSPIGLAQR